MYHLIYDAMAVVGAWFTATCFLGLLFGQLVRDTTMR